MSLTSQVIFKSSEVAQVNLASTTGDMGILSGHVQSTESLRPGVLEVIESTGGNSKKWFVSGGFASIHADNALTINAVEAHPLEDFSSEVRETLRVASHVQAIRSGLQEAQRVASGSGTDLEKAEAKAEVEVRADLRLFDARRSSRRSKCAAAN